MNISKFFIDRPIFAGVLSVVVLLAGVIAMFNLPISEYPEVVPPSVVVHAQYPGANPKVIAETVASAPTRTRRSSSCRTACRRRCRVCRRT
jgi:multidrug efflux pump